MTLTIDGNAAAAIRPLLEPGETILWAGRPRQGIVFRAIDWLLTPFNLAALAFLLHIANMTTPITTWLHRSWTFDSIFFLVIHSAVGCMLLYLLLGRHLHDRAHRASHNYAVTSRRVITQNASRIGRPGTTIGRGELPRATIFQHRNRRGTITFDGSYWDWQTSDLHFPMIMFITSWTFYCPALGRSRMFFQIENAETVYALITSPTK